MTRHFHWNTLKLYRHTLWRNLTLIYGFSLGYILHYAVWAPPATAIPLRMVLILITPPLLATIGFAGWRQHREHPEGLIPPLLLGTIGIACLGIALYYAVVSGPFTSQMALASLMGIIFMLFALFAKNMAATFIFSRKDLS